MSFESHNCIRFQRLLWRLIPDIDFPLSEKVAPQVRFKSLLFQVKPLPSNIWILDPSKKIATVHLWVWACVFASMSLCVRARVNVCMCVFSLLLCFCACMCAFECICVRLSVCVSVVCVCVRLCGVLCVWVCICVRVLVFVCITMCACICVWVRLCMKLHMRECVSVCESVSVCACVCLWECACTCAFSARLPAAVHVHLCASYVVQELPGVVDLSTRRGHLRQVESSILTSDCPWSRCLGVRSTMERRVGATFKSCSCPNWTFPLIQKMHVPDY